MQIGASSTSLVDRRSICHCQRTSRSCSSRFPPPPPHYVSSYILPYICAHSLFSSSCCIAFQALPTEDHFSSSFVACLFKIMCSPFLSFSSSHFLRILSHLASSRFAPMSFSAYSALPFNFTPLSIYPDTVYFPISIVHRVRVNGLKRFARQRRDD